MSNHSHNYHKHASGNLLVVFVLSLIFNVVVIIGGLLTNSVAIIADSLHDLSDTIAIGLAWLLEKFSQKENNDKYTYGYERFSLLGAIITSTLVIVVSVVVLFEAYERLFVSVTPDVSGMFLVAILGIVFKGISIVKLHGGRTFNEKAILFHLFGDVFEWIGILAISVILMFVNIPFLDPLVSILIAIWLIYKLGKVLIDSFRVLLQKTPKDIDLKTFKKKILAIDHVIAIENIHLWSLDGLENILTLKLVVDNLENSESIKKDVLDLSDKISNEYSTIELINK